MTVFPVDVPTKRIVGPLLLPAHEPVKFKSPATSKNDVPHAMLDVLPVVFIDKHWLGEPDVPSMVNAPDDAFIIQSVVRSGIRPLEAPPDELDHDPTTFQAPVPILYIVAILHPDH